MIKQKIDNFTQDVLKYWGQLPARMKKLSILLAVSIIFSFSFNTYYKPQRIQMYRLRQELNSLKNKNSALKVKIPDIETENRLLNKEQTSLSALKKELLDLESQLPHHDSLPELLRELFTQSEGFSLDIISIKPIDEKKKDEYDLIDIELKFTSQYSNFINYIYAIENLSRFVTIQSVEIAEQENSASFDLAVTMVLSMLSMQSDDSSPQLQAKSAKMTLKPIIVKRNPFTTAAKQSFIRKDQKEFMLSGIISQGPQPTAIVNDTVYTVGDIIGNNELVEISAEQVVLRSGQETIVLTLEND